MKNRYSFIPRIVFGIFLSLAVVAGFTSCEPPASTPAYVETSFIGTWENKDFPGFVSTYKVSSNKIEDVSMSCDFEVVTKDTVVSADGYTLVFTKCVKGTDYTPAGNFYVIALKLDSDKLKISCPIDFASKYSSLDELKSNYTASYNVSANGNFDTTCTKAN